MRNNLRPRTMQVGSSTNVATIGCQGGHHSNVNWTETNFGRVQSFAFCQTTSHTNASALPSPPIYGTVLLSYWATHSISTTPFCIFRRRPPLLPTRTHGEPFSARPLASTFPVVLRRHRRAGPVLRGDVRQRQLRVLRGVERVHGLCAYGPLRVGRPRPLLWRVHTSHQGPLGNLSCAGVDGDDHVGSRDHGAIQGEKTRSLSPLAQGQQHPRAVFNTSHPGPP